MIRTLSIEHFRGVSQAKIEGLSQVNLFFGKNNCGKSSVLEALFLLTNDSNPLNALALNQMRGYFVHDTGALKVDFHNMETEQPIYISVDADVPREVTINLFTPNTENVSLNNKDVLNTQPTYGLNFKYKIAGIEYKNSLVLTEGQDTANLVRDEKLKAENLTAYLPPSYMYFDATDMLAKLIASKQEAPIIKILQKVEPKIQSINLVGKEIMVDTGLNQLMPIKLMGDGIKKYLFVILAIFQCKDGVIMIDEIDNGFHYSLMPDLWTSVMNAAQAFNVQVFATTHNIDSIKSLSSLLMTAPEYQKAGAAFKLIKQADDKLIALKYDYSQLFHTLNQEVEIR